MYFYLVLLWSMLVAELADLSAALSLLLVLPQLFLMGLHFLKLRRTHAATDSSAVCVAQI